MSDTRISPATLEDEARDGIWPLWSLQAWGAAGTEVVRRQAWLIALILGYIALGLVLGQIQGHIVTLNLYGASLISLYAVFAFVAVVIHGTRRLYRNKPASPIAFLIKNFKPYFVPRRILEPLPVLVLMGLFISVISSIKRLIPIIQPFDWDRDFAEIDRVLHGGIHPWELLQPIFGYPPVTQLVSEFYGYPWLIAVALLQFWLVFTSHPDRQRLLLTNVLAWILLGNVAAIVFSSAGPVYYDNFVAGTNPYDGLMAYLSSVNEQTPLGSMDTQAYLWSMHQNGEILPGTGISAMPSMHLSMGTLMVLAASRLDKRLMALALIYLVFLQLGSVHLGWHYAIDGYAGIAGTLAIWWVLGRILRPEGAKRPPSPGRLHFSTK